MKTSALLAEPPAYQTIHEVGLRGVKRTTIGGWQDRELTIASYTVVGATVEECRDLLWIMRDWKFDERLRLGFEQFMARVESDLRDPELKQPRFPFGAEHSVIGGWVEPWERLSFTFHGASPLLYRRLVDLVQHGEWSEDLTCGLNSLVSRFEYDQAERAAGRI